MRQADAMIVRLKVGEIVIIMAIRGVSLLAAKNFVCMYVSTGKFKMTFRLKY